MYNEADRAFTCDVKSLATRVVLDQLNHHDQLDRVKIELNIVNNKYYVNYFFEEKEEEPSISEKKQAQFVIWAR